MPTLNRLPRFAAALLLCAALPACEATTEPHSDPERIRLSPPFPAVVAGAPLQLVARVEDAAGRTVPGATFSWSTADTSIATVDESGLLVGRLAGVTTLTVTAAGLSHEVDVTVSGPRVVTARLHMCAIDDPLGAVWCWGRGDDGQLGTGARANQPSPVRVQPDTVPFGDVAVGWAHTCASELVSNFVWCWGRGERGRLGTGMTADALLPARIADEQNYVGLAAGGQHTCGWRRSGRVACWGDNWYGQLGSAGALAVATPVDVALFADDVSAGASHSCGVQQESGRVFCWGRGDAGQLGDGSAADRPDPAAISDATPYARVSAGERHTCGLSTTGVARCWGAGASGQLGNGAAVNQPTATLVETDLTFSSISAGARHTCAVAADGSAWCWGSNHRGQLGTGDRGPAAVPVRVAGESVYVDVAAGYDFTCALTGAGVVECWGANDEGQLGSGDLVDRLEPAPIDADVVFRALARH